MIHDITKEQFTKETGKNHTTKARMHKRGVRSCTSGKISY